jgi:beta-mannanase
LILEFKRQNQSRAAFTTPRSADDDQSAEDFSDTLNQHQLDLSSSLKKQQASADSDLLSFINSLQVSAWVEIRNQQTRRSERGKLKWKAQDNSLFIFIDRRGHKICECSLDRLKVMFSKEQIKLLSAATGSGKKKSPFGQSYRVFNE